MDFKDGLKILSVLLCLLILFAMSVFAVDYAITTRKDSYIIVKLPDGNIVEGYGKYRDSYKQAYVCVDETWYRTSYQNVVIMTKK